MKSGDDRSTRAGIVRPLLAACSVGRSPEFELSRKIFSAGMWKWRGFLRDRIGIMEMAEGFGVSTAHFVEMAEGLEGFPPLNTLNTRKLINRSSPRTRSDPEGPAMRDGTRCLQFQRATEAWSFSVTLSGGVGTQHDRRHSFCGEVCLPSGERNGNGLSRNAVQNTQIFANFNNDSGEVSQRVTQRAREQKLSLLIGRTDRPPRLRP
jgi:hypothetical protein